MLIRQLSVSRMRVGESAARLAPQITISVLWGALAILSSGLALAAGSDAKLTYEAHIRPIFRAHCFDCHGATDELKGNLDLRLVRTMIAGGETGPAIVPGQPNSSHLVDRIQKGEMPPGEKKVSKSELAIIVEWISQGAPTTRPEPASVGAGIGLTEEERNFWFFQPIRPKAMSAAAGDHLLQRPIDALVTQPSINSLTLESRRDSDSDRVTEAVTITLAPTADRRTLIKRAYFDLLGLPPNPDEMKGWLEASSSDWFERLVNELLVSPRYGEHWARHWLDVAGYADSDGFTVNDPVRPWIWKYRDWVIRALNSDLPFDQFVVAQLAGDELAGPQVGDLTPGQIELLTATGFLRLAADGTGSGADTPEARNQVIADTLKIVGSSMFGLTIHCAQCHDHRYDPIHQSDYFALRAVFEPALDWKSWKAPDARRVSLYTANDRQRAAEVEADAQKIATERQQKQTMYLEQALEKELMKFEEPLRSQLRAAYQAAGDRRTEEQKQLLAKHPSVNITPGVLYQYLPEAAEDLKKFDSRINETRAKKPVEEFLHALVEPPGHIPETRLFFRGDHQQPRQVVLPRAPAVAAPEHRPFEFPLDDPSLPTTGRRLALANWLTRPDNPLFARVIVNRVWMHHFGKGLVATPADFGKLGVLPEHPELLDFLASEFIRDGWSLKSLHRNIMTSSVWQQTKSTDQRLSGMVSNTTTQTTRLVRLEAESIRDRMLAATGDLSSQMYGPPLAIKEDESGQVVVDGSQTRRSLYIQVRRSRPVAMLQAFDAPVMETNCEARSSSTIATQSLMLLNGEFILEQAGKLAARAAAEATPLSSEQLVGIPQVKPTSSSNWQYGYGWFDEECGATVGFTRLPHWTGSQWQGGANLPDQDVGWVLLHARGGHPDVTQRSAIRRWNAPVGGIVSISGSLSHGSANGNGVRGRIISSRSGKLAEWTVHNGKVETSIDRMEIVAGDLVDFVTDSMGDVTSDSFEWLVTIRRIVPGQPDHAIVSAEQFSGPGEPADRIPAQIVKAWELALCRPPSVEELSLAINFVNRQLETFQSVPESVPSGKSGLRQALTNVCQSLLSSNEFLYVE